LAGELLDELKAQGYSPSWSVVQLRLLAGLSCWLEDKELGGEGITAGVLEEFSAARIAAGGPSSRVLLPGGGLMRFLRSHGCLAVDVVPVPGPAEELLGRFRRHLTMERGLQLGTINNYERAARVFLEAVGFPSRLERLEAREVTRFVVQEAARSKHHLGHERCLWAAKLPAVRLCRGPDGDAARLRGPDGSQLAGRGASAFDRPCCRPTPRG